MANKALFSKSAHDRAPAADTRNAAGGKAYSHSDKHALAQYAATGTFHGTYYVGAKDHLKTALDLANKVEPEFLAKVAVYSRQNSFMKDMPAFLAVVLAKRDPSLLRKVARRILDNTKMVRNFVQMARSGVVGRRFNLSAGVCRSVLQDFFDRQHADKLFRTSYGNDPRLADVIKMARIKPNKSDKEALFAYLIGGLDYLKPNRGGRKNVHHNDRDLTDALPELVKQYEAYKKDKGGTVPDVPFQFLDSLGIGKKEWSELASTMTWQTLRMNLNNLQKYGVFDTPANVNAVAKRLCDRDEIERARVFPYQLLMAYNAATGVPAQVREALQDAMEIAVENVPAFSDSEGVFVCPDVSGSMSQPVTGYRGRVSSNVRCVDVSALISSVVLRNNKYGRVLPFDGQVRSCDLNPRDSIVTNARKLGALCGGATNCSAPLALLNKEKARGNVVIYVSDSESWVDSHVGFWYSSQYGGGTGMLNEWKLFKKRNPQAKLVCIDVVPRTNSQVKEHEDILQVGGFSDDVFRVMASFFEGGTGSDHWVDVVEAVSLDE